MAFALLRATCLCSWLIYEARASSTPASSSASPSPSPAPVPAASSTPQPSEAVRQSHAHQQTTRAKSSTLAPSTHAPSAPAPSTPAPSAPAPSTSAASTAASSSPALSTPAPSAPSALSPSPSPLPVPAASSTPQPSRQPAVLIDASTALTHSVAPGAVELPVNGSVGFQVDREVIIDAGTPREVNHMFGFGSNESIILKAPLRHAHGAGVSITMPVAPKPPAAGKPVLEVKLPLIRVSWEIPHVKQCPVTHISIAMRGATRLDEVGSAVWQLVDTANGVNLLVPAHGAAATAPTKSIVVNALELGKDYEAKVNMKNCQGWGQWSLPSDAVRLLAVAEPWSVAAKFSDDHAHPEKALAMRHQPLFPSWATTMLWLSIPGMIGMVLVYRKKFLSSGRSDRGAPDLCASCDIDDEDLTAFGDDEDLSASMLERSHIDSARGPERRFEFESGDLDDTRALLSPA